MKHIILRPIKVNALGDTLNYMAAACKIALKYPDSEFILHKGMSDNNLKWMIKGFGVSNIKLINIYQPTNGYKREGSAELGRAFENQYLEKTKKLFPNGFFIERNSKAMNNLKINIDKEPSGYLTYQFDAGSKNRCLTEEQQEQIFSRYQKPMVQVGGGMPIEECAELIAKSDGHVGADSGLAHLAGYILDDCSSIHLYRADNNFTYWPKKLAHKKGVKLCQL